MYSPSFDVGRGSPTPSYTPGITKITGSSLCEFLGITALTSSLGPGPNNYSPKLDLASGSTSANTRIPGTTPALNSALAPDPNNYSPDLDLVTGSTPPPSYTHDNTNEYRQYL